MNREINMSNNRIIKFRAWVKADGGYGQMVYPHLEMYDGIFKLPANYILLQFTGLKDSKGVEIYEGDIIKWLVFPENEEPVYVIDSVCFGNGCYKLEKRIELLGTKEPHRKLEIIGSIYENPELLS